ncbi:hypothetical protein COBT_001290 [Conglomerata obtusa]
MAQLLKKNWKEGKKKKAVCPLKWNEQKEKLLQLKNERKSEKAKVDEIRAKKRTYMSAMKKKRLEKAKENE